MNWGVKIMLVFSLFVAGMLFMVFKSARQNMDLVVPDYYEQELKYQDIINATIRTQALKGAIDCKVINDSVVVNFPQEMEGKELKGEVWLYCIADKKKDIKKDFAGRLNSIGFTVSMYNKGAHEIKVSWQANDSSYYYQQKIFIQ